MISFNRKSLVQDLVDQILEDSATLLSRRVSLHDSFQALRYTALCKPQQSLELRSRSAIAIAAAAMKQCYGVEPYRTQILAAHWMSRGTVVDMATGEGKSIAVLLASLAIAAGGCGVHIATANDYLAQRDCEFAKPVANCLGLHCDHIPSTGCLPDNRHAYQAALAFGTLSGFAFDHLRDDLSRTRMQGARRSWNVTPPAIRLRRHWLIIDEIDHCLLDDALTPFVLAESGVDPVRSDSAQAVPYRIAGDIANQLQEGIDYEQTSEIDFRLTHTGTNWAEASRPENDLCRPWSDYLLNALRAAHGLRQDVDYTVDGTELRLVDKATGRFAIGRQWQAGLHQAVQCHLGLAVQPEHQALAQITARQFVAEYHQVGGCSGTALAGKLELASAYQLAVKSIPNRLPSHRLILQPRFFAGQSAKWNAITSEVIELHQRQRPVLIGTRSIAQSIRFSEQLRTLKLPFQLLNGTQDHAEAEVIAQAGQRAAITVATDMAGRGTDIPIDSEVSSIGGLHVIVSELSHSPRIDQQLMGRAARQGQHGSARVFVAADDELIRQHAPALHRFLLHRLTPGTSQDWLWKEVMRAGDRSERSYRVRREAAAFAARNPKARSVG